MLWLCSRPAGRLALAAAICATAPGPARAEVTLRGAIVVADRAPSFQWTEGAKDIENWYRTDYKPGALVRVFVRNAAARPVALVAMALDGQRYEAGTPLVGMPVVWFRLRPEPLAPGGFGQLEVRLRAAPAGQIRLEFFFDTGQRLPVTVGTRQPKLHIERVAFARTGDAVIWCSVGAQLSQPPALIVDGVRSAAGQYAVLGPWRGAMAVVYTPRKPLEYGSFHYFALKDRRGVIDAAVVRVRDSFFPLGTYGYVRPREYAVNSLNLYASFGQLNKSSLDALAAYGLKAITPGEGSGFDRRPAQSTLGHPAIWAYYLHDEPDVTDYFKADAVPHAVRIGAHAMEMVARERNVYRDEPAKLSYLVIDQTYKPANWFVYGPIADVCATDRYPPPGRGFEAFMTTETCRMACGPNMLVFIFRAYWLERTDGKPSKPPRMMYAGEEKLHVAWALAGGAQGLISYIHCTEKTGRGISRGVGEYPDAWHAIGQMYRQVETIAPVLATAWPVDGAVLAPKGIYARALVSPLGMAVVLINDAGCRSTDDDFIVTPAENVAIECDLPPWLAGAAAATVGEGRFQRLEAGGAGRLRVTVPRVETATLLLVARPSVMTGLEKRFAAVRGERSRALLDGMQRDLAARALRLDLQRRIPARYGRFVAYASAYGAYGLQRPGDFWNPRAEKYNALAWYDPAGKDEHWVEWKFTAGAGTYYFIFAWQSMGRPAVVSVRGGPDGAKVAGGRVRADGPTIRAVRLRLPAAGDWLVRLAAPAGERAAARVAKAAFLVPAADASLLPPSVLDLSGSQAADSP